MVAVAVVVFAGEGAHWWQWYKTIDVVKSIGVGLKNIPGKTIPGIAVQLAAKSVIYRWVDLFTNLTFCKSIVTPGPTIILSKVAKDLNKSTQGYKKYSHAISAISKNYRC